MRALSITVALAMIVLPASAAGLQRLQSFRVGPLPASLLQRPIPDMYRPVTAAKDRLPWFTGTFVPVHASRYAWNSRPIPINRPARAGVTPPASQYAMGIFDLQKRQFIWPVADFSQALPDADLDPHLLAFDEATAQGALSVSTSRSKETLTLVRTSKAPDGGTVNEYKRTVDILYRTHFAHWDLASGSIDWTVPLQAEEDRHGRAAIGIDPTGHYFYFAETTFTHEPANPYEPAPMAAWTIRRLDVMTRTVDWSHTIPLPGRDQTKQALLGGLSVHSSPDFTRFAITEYCEPSHGKVSPPPQAWVVDVPSSSHWAFEIPRLPYGVTFDRQNRFLVIGSHNEGKLFRYNLATRKRDMVVGSIPAIQRAFTSADNRTLYVLSRHQIEQRSWPDLKPLRAYVPQALAPGQSFFEPEGLAIMPDGRSLVMNETDKQIGAATQTGFYLLSL
jgi:hypothetical protein